MASLTFGRVPHPPFQDRLVLDVQNGAWDYLGQRAVMGARWHRMVGTLTGTDGWFRRGAASDGLTDYGIGCAATDGPGLAGVIYRWNDPTGKAHSGVSPNRSPWASGPYSSSCAYGDGRRNVAERGVNAVNRDGVSIEVSGNYDTPLDDKCRDSLIKLTAYWADQARVPWDAFPTDPARGYGFVKYHKEYCGNPDPPESCPQGVKACPGMVVVNETPTLFQRIAAYLKSYQVTEEEDPLADIAKSSYTLDPAVIWPNASTGAVGKLWRDYGEATGIFNPPGQPWNDKQSDGTVLFQFDGGPLIATTKDGKTGIVVKSK